ncbi:MAG: hypothetical protein JNN15_14895 [Blastocatellia bacterium]|nr:hypothetical protein [Blastocatellia bacterium]
MKKIFLSISFIAAIALFGFYMSDSTVTKANNSMPRGSYGVKLTGSIPTSATTRAEIGLVGQFDIDSRGNFTGSRTLVIAGTGPVPGGDFNCRFTQINSNGTGSFTCRVVDAITGPAGRDDSFRYTIVDNGKEMLLNFIDGIPGAVVTGSAIRQ